MPSATTATIALDRDVTRGFPVAIFIQVLPLAVVGWTLRSAHTLDGTIVISQLPTSMPGAVTVSVQKANIAHQVDWRPLLLLSSQLPIAKIYRYTSPLLSCFFGDGHCD